MVVDNLIKNRESDFRKLCKEHAVKYLFAFGSSVTNNFDLMVEINKPDPINRGEKIISLWDKLENFFKRKVDLRTNSAIRNPYLKQNIDESKVLIYDSSR
jgi:predicted nucleotidyltransferase